MRNKLWIAALLAIAPAAFAQSVAGLWDATIILNDVQIPFRIEFAGEGSNFQGWFFNGDEKVISTAGKLENGALVLNFDQYATKLEATLKDGQLEGQYGPMQKKLVAFRANKAVATPAADAHAPSIAGDWEIGVKSPKGELAWRLIVRQSGPEVSAAILRVDGDTGSLTGRYRDGKFVLSHFSAARPGLLELNPASDGTLDVTLTSFKETKQYKATRPAESRAKGLPEPTDPSLHTRVKDPSEPLRFNFPDLNGQLVSNTDARFQGKVVVVNVTGSWCPNCHDEAPFLAALYRKYRDDGLEIVALSFEEAEQLKNPTRLRAFIKQYGIEYTVLLGGETAEVRDKLPQAVNLNTWPATFFVGRDGLVRAVHAGYAGAASGDAHRLLTEEITAQVEKLLAENQTSSR
jgi:thiol-disulfide isomerase/thioredoxin